MINLNLARMNRLAGLSILPMMLLAIAVFSQVAGETVAPPASGAVAVANLREHSLTFVDFTSGARTELRLPGPPHEMVEAGGRVYVTLGRAGLLVEVDPGAPAILRTVRLEGEPHGLAALGPNLYLTLDKSNVVVVLDRSTLTELGRIPTGDTPHVIAATAAGIFVTDSRADTLRRLEPSFATVPTGAQPEGIAVGDRTVVTADALSGTVTVAPLDLSTARSVRVGPGPVRIIPFGAGFAVSLQAASEVVVLAADGDVERRLETRDRPDGLCSSPDGRHLAVASNAGATLELFGGDGLARSSSYLLQPGLGACLWLTR